MLESPEIPQDVAACRALIVAQLEQLSLQALTNAAQAARLEAQAARLQAQEATIAQQAARLAATEKQLAELAVEQEKLRKLLSHFVNGHHSEKRIIPAPDQRYLPFDNSAEFEAAKAEAEAEAQALVQKITITRKLHKKKRHEGLPSHLRRVERIIDIDEALRTCATHGARTLIGYDITETLVHTRPELYVLVKKYPKYACPDSSACGVTSPERPTSLVEGERYDTSVAATIIEAKWFFHLPLYRQQDLFAGSGWTPDRSTLANLVASVEFVISSLIAYMKSLVQKDTAVGLDDTTCRLLLPTTDPVVVAGDAKSARFAEKVAEAKAAKEKSVVARMWVYSGLNRAPYNIFDFRVSRHRDGPEDFFGDSECIVQGDCFSGNTSVILASDERLKFAACWAHARRKVFESNTYEKERDLLLGMIQALYDVETRGKELAADERRALRQRESVPILSTIKQWLDTERLGDVLPKSDFAEALRYIRNHWDALQVFVTDGDLPIDNNSVEQLMKQVAMGRKAWLFVCSVAGGEQSAKMMTLVSSARRHDLDVAVYIKDVLDQLLAGSTNYHALLPDVWKQSHPEAVREYRVEERRDKADRKQLEAARRRLANAASR